MRVAITGVTGSIGKQLANRLVYSPDIEEVIGIGRKNKDEIVGLSPDVTYYSCPIHSSQLTRHLKGVDSVVHLAWVVAQSTTAEEDLIDLEGSKNVLRASTSAGIGKLIFSSSNKVYGFGKYEEKSFQSKPFDEDDPVSTEGQLSYIKNKIAVERLFLNYQRDHLGKQVSILRVATVVGPKTDTPLTRALQKRFLISLKGFNPERQFIYEEDAVRAFQQALFSNSSGVFNVSPDDSVQQSDIHWYLGNTPLRLPARACEYSLNIAHALGITDYNALGLDFIKYSILTSNEKIKRELGWHPRSTSAQALQSIARK